MSAELHWYFEDPSKNMGQHLAENEIAWVDGYSDEDGRLAGIWVLDGETQIIRGHLETEELESGLEVRIRDHEVIASLPVNEPRVLGLKNERGQRMYVHIRNLGVCRDNPDMHPAWN